MALPTLDELRRLRESVPTLAQGIQGASDSFNQGQQLASVINTRQQEVDNRKLMLQKAVEALGIKKQATDASVDYIHAKTDALENQPDTTDVFTVDEKGNLKKSGTVPKGSKVMSNQDKMGSPIAVSRLASAALNDITKSADLTRNKMIIERGQRIESIGDPSQVVQNPAVLSLVQEAVEAQTRGGVSSAAGVKKVANETPEQFAARIMEKIRNAPQDADTTKFMDQLKSISRQETKAAIRGLQGTILGNAEAAATIYDDSNPDLAQAIRNGSKKLVNEYLTRTLGVKISQADLSPSDVNNAVDDSGKTKPSEQAAPSVSPEVEALINALGED